LKKIFNYLGLFGVAGVVIALDQWTKALVRANIAPSELWLPAGFDWLMPYARLINWHNSGAAFGSFQGFSLVFTVLAFVVSGLIIYYYPQVAPADWWLKLAMGMQLGGALGNVVDRLTQQGQVTDFISVGTFPVFNVADSSISVGVAILLLGVWIKERAERKQTGSGDPRPTGEPRQTDAGSGDQPDAGSGDPRQTEEGAGG
jgi:signal peptidase II